MAEVAIGVRTRFKLFSHAVISTERDGYSRLPAFDVWRIMQANSQWWRIMATSQQLVHRWQERLALGERLRTNRSPRLRWIGQVYIRLYRFLLSVYGKGEWRSDVDSPWADDEDSIATEAATETASRMPFVDHTSHESGAPAKSIGAIRATLKRVHAANPERPKGSRSGRMSPHDWIVVAAESGHVEPWECVKLLRRHGIKARSIDCGADVYVEVRRLDFKFATTLIAQNKDRIHRHLRMPRRKNTPFPFLVLGVFLTGVLLTLIALVFE